MISLVGSRFRVKYDFDNNKYRVFTRNHSGQKEVTESLSAEDKEELLDDLIYDITELVAKES